MYSDIAEGAKALRLDPGGLQAACRAIDREIARGVTPGAVLAVVRHGEEWMYTAGYADPGQDIPVKVHAGVLYDCASLTKVVVTLPLMLGLIDEGILTLGTTVASWLPEFTGEGKEEVTIGQLLTHTSGLPADKNLHSHGWTRTQMWEEASRVPLRSKPGTVAVYSDLGYLILGRIAERVLGMPLDVAARTKIWEPLGMDSAAFAPPITQQNSFAATEYDPELGGHLCGGVHDEKSRALGGVCGHAGLFATAGDLACYARMWLARGAATEDGSSLLAADSKAPRRILSQAAVKASIQSYTSGIEGANRGLGWALKGDHWDASGDWMGPRCFGHTGFTGTSLWIEPDLEFAVILLTNRVYYGRSGSVAMLRASIHNAITAAVRI